MGGVTIPMDDSLAIFIRRVVRIILTLLVVGVLANDGYRVINAFATASRGMNAAMSAAMDTASASPANTLEMSQAAAASAADAQGGQLTEFGQESAVSGNIRKIKTTLAVGAPVDNTVLAGPIIGLVRGTPASEAQVVVRETKKLDVF